MNNHATNTHASLPHDPLWPRAGAWPTLETATEAQKSDPRRVVLLGVPTHATSISDTGADKTPAAVRAAIAKYSADLAPGGMLPTVRDLLVFDAGDAPEPDERGDAETAVWIAERTAGAGLTIALGGDNSLTTPVMLGTCGGADTAGDASAGAGGDTLRESAGLITVDAHFDLRDGISNGSPVRRLLEAGVDGSRVAQLGIADFANSVEYAQRARDYGITVVHRDEFEAVPLQEIAERALGVAGADGGPIHVDIDVDACDRAVAPGCPASIPGGLSAWQLRRLVRLLTMDSRVVSIDFAEVDATADTADARTVRLTALCVLEALVGFASRPQR